MALWNKRSLSEALAMPIGYDFEASGLSIDSRSIKPGDLFIGIKGEHMDGSVFAQQALEKGAIACLVNSGTVSGARIIAHADTTDALLRMAKYRRATLPSESVVIGITGSVGKTSTKCMMDLVLSQFATTYSTHGNLNNHYGLPLSLASAPLAAQHYVIEMGMNHAGEIEYLSKITRPHIAVITNSAAVHLEFFHSVADIAYAKAEIYKGMEHNALAIINYDDANSPIFIAKAKEQELKIITFGESNGADYQLLDYDSSGATTIVTYKSPHQTLNYSVAGKLGKHLALNSMAVFAVVGALGYDLQHAAQALHGFQALRGRGAVLELKQGITLLDDSYNASPASVQAALAVLSSHRRVNGRVIAILGDMKELGESAKELHEKLADSVAANNIDLVCTVGEMMNALYNVLPEQLRLFHTNNSSEMAAKILPALLPGDVILVKGSFSMAMNKIVEAIALHL